MTLRVAERPVELAKGGQMYNLFVSADENDWGGDPFVVARIAVRVDQRVHRTRDR